MDKPMTRTSRLKQIAARVEAATRGPWTAEVDRFDDETGWIVLLSNESLALFAKLEPADVTGESSTEVCTSQAMRDGQFLAAARSDVPWLLREVERMREALKGVYPLIKQAFVCPTTDTDGRKYTDVSPNSMVRIKGALREYIDAALEDSDDAG